MIRRKRSFQESAGEGQKSNPNRAEAKGNAESVSELKWISPLRVFTCDHKGGKF